LNIDDRSSKNPETQIPERGIILHDFPVRVYSCSIDGIFTVRGCMKRELEKRGTLI